MQLCIPSQDAPEYPSAEVSLLCQHVAVSHSLASGVALTEPVPLRFIKCSCKTEMNLFYTPPSGVLPALLPPSILFYSYVQPLNLCS